MFILVVLEKKIQSQIWFSSSASVSFFVPCRFLLPSREKANVWGSGLEQDYYWRHHSYHKVNLLANTSFFFFFLAAEHVGFWFPNQGSNLLPLH